MGIAYKHIERLVAVEMRSQTHVKSVDKIVPDAYHGTSHENAIKITQGEGFIPGSEESFLGKGIYFYEGSLEDAKQWARGRNRRAKIGVICAIIKLGRCLDLHNKEHRELIKKVATILQKDWKREDITDAVAISFLTSNFGEDLDSVKATQFPSHIKRPNDAKLFPGSRFYDHTKIMICVKNIKNILQCSIC